MQVAAEDQAQLLASVDRAVLGESAVVTRNGVAVARIVPMEDFDPTPQSLLHGREREEAIRRLKELLTIGIPLGGVAPTKDEMHERD